MPSPLREFQRRLNQRPFQPLTLVFDDGDRLLVGRPDQIVIAATHSMALFGLNAEQFEASYGVVGIGGASRAVMAVEYLGADGFPVELFLNPDEEEWRNWKRVRSWSWARKACKITIAVSFAAMIVSPFWSAESGFDGGHFLPMGELLWRKKVVTAIILSSGIIAVVAAGLLYSMDRSFHQSFRRLVEPIETSNAHDPPPPLL